MKNHKHVWQWQKRNNGKELWDVCTICGKEKELKIISIEPLKGGSGISTKRERRGSSSYRVKDCSHVWDVKQSHRMCVRCGKQMKKRPAKKKKISTSEIDRRFDEIMKKDDSEY